MAKTSKQIMLEREKLIVQLMGQGVDRKDILTQVAEKYNLREASVEYQYYKILKEMQQLADEKKDDLRATLMARQDLIYRKSLEKDQLKTALDATVAQSKLAGLDQKVQEKEKTPDAILIKEKDFTKLEPVPSPKKAENE